MYTTAEARCTWKQLQVRITNFHWFKTHLVHFLWEVQDAGTNLPHSLWWDTDNGIHFSGRSISFLECRSRNVVFFPWELTLLGPKSKMLGQFLECLRVCTLYTLDWLSQFGYVQSLHRNFSRLVQKNFEFSAHKARDSDLSNPTALRENFLFRLKWERLSTAVEKPGIETKRYFFSWISAKFHRCGSWTGADEKKIMLNLSILCCTVPVNCVILEALLDWRTGPQALSLLIESPALFSQWDDFDFPLFRSRHPAQSKFQDLHLLSILLPSVICLPQ